MQPVSSVSRERQGRRSIRPFILAAALVVALAIPAAVLAGKGSGGSSSTPWIALASVDNAALAAAAAPRLGSSVKFSTGYPTGTKNPWVSVFCYQDGNVVYAEGGKPSADFVLGGATSDWAATGGAASCSAELGDLYWRGGKQYYTFLAKTWFEAGE